MQTEYHKEFEKTIRSVSHSKHLWEVFSDFCEMAAISLSNAICPDQEREKRYLEIVVRYQPEEVQILPKLLGITAMALEGAECDFLGEMFMGLELASHWHGQFFTPFHVCHLMAEMNLAGIEEAIEKRGFATTVEPCCGAGAMVIGLAKACLKNKINYQQRLHVTAIDISATAAHMAYIQFTLLHIPAIVYTGNSLTMEIREPWVTPAHVYGFWNHRLKNQSNLSEQPETSDKPESPLLFPPDSGLEQPEVKEPAYPINKREYPVQPSLFV